jgi:hypothetical protein
MKLWQPAWCKVPKPALTKGIINEVENANSRNQLFSSQGAYGYAQAWLLIFCQHKPGYFHHNQFLKIRLL